MEISIRLTRLFASSSHAAMRRRGSKNYKNDVLIDIVAKFLPNGELGWKTVAVAYQEQSREEVLRDHADIKKHWIKKLCNEMKKPTGATGENNDRIARCIAIEKKILDKTSSGILGLSSGDEDSSSNDGGGAGGDIESSFEDSIFDVGSMRGGGGGNGEINESFDSVRETEHDNNDECPRAELVAPENPDVPAVLPSIRHQGAQEEGGEDVTPRGTIRRAESAMKGQKTKNSSNKNKERTSIAGAIVKLIEKQESGENADVAAKNMAANMSMMMMRQLEAMNKSMDRREERERRRERKERKRQKKRRAKKKAKKRAKMAAAAALEDHGGKAGQGYSSSSDSDSCTDYGDSDTSSSLSDQDSAYGTGLWRKHGGGNDGGGGEES